MVDLLFLGFDGLDYERYRGRSSYPIDELYSPVSVTGTAWTSLYTGDSLQTHGVRDTWGRSVLEQMRAGDWTLGFLVQNLLVERNRFHTYESTPSTPFWERLNDGGVSTNLVNLPVTYPARPVDGVQVSGFPQPASADGQVVEPTSVSLPASYRELSDMIQWVMDPYTDGHGSWRPAIEEMGLEATLQRSRAHSRQLLEFAASLPAADVTALQWSFVDRLGHVFGIREGTEDSIFSLVDDLIDEAVETFEPETLVVVSDHGFEGKDHTQEGVFIHEGMDLPDLSGKTVTTRDVAPTICSRFGIELPCDGVPLQSLPDDRELEETADLERMRDHLETLGYLE